MVTRSLKVLETVASWLEKLSLGAAVLLLLVMAAFMFSSIIARYVFNSPIPWSEELLTFLLSYSIFVVLGAVTRGDQHIKIGFVMERLLGERKAQRVSTILENVIGLGLTAFLAYTAVRWAAESHATGEREFTHFIQNFYPVWIIKVLPAVGICLLSFFYFERCARQLLSFISSRRQMGSARGSTAPDSTTRESEGP